MLLSAEGEELLKEIDEADKISFRFRDIKNSKKSNTAYIFPNKSGCHIQDIKTSFKSTLKRAEVTDFRPLDRRYIIASHYIIRGVSIKTLKESLGHKDIKTTMRYAHLSKEFAKKEIQLINGLTSVKKGEGKKKDGDTVTKLSHFQNLQ